MHEDYAPLIIDSLLRCLDWENDFKIYFRNNAPKFANYPTQRQAGEFGTDLKTAHDEFIRLLESTFERHLHTSDPLMNSMRFYSVIGRTVERRRGGDESLEPLHGRLCENLIDQLDGYCNFISFGEMMHEKWLQQPGSQGEKFQEEQRPDSSLAIVPPGSRHTTNALAAVPSSSSSSTTSSPASLLSSPAAPLSSLALPLVSSAHAAHGRHVRCLWDIENVAVPKGLGPLDAVARLKAFLGGLSPPLSGAGIDCRVSAFFNPRRARQEFTADLDRASVEIIWVSEKREDAGGKCTDEEISRSPFHLSFHFSLFTYTLYEFCPVLFSSPLSNLQIASW